MTKGLELSVYLSSSGLLMEQSLRIVASLVLPVGKDTGTHMINSLINKRKAFSPCYQYILP